MIAYPTEAVFGLGCDPLDAAAVLRLLALKHRRMAEGLILIACSLHQLKPFVEAPDEATRRQLEATWPGPVTWLLPARDEVPAWLTGRHPTLAVRVTAHPGAAALCARYGGPLVSTSANVSGTPPARSALAVRRKLGAGVDYVLPGRVGDLAAPTEIRDAASGRVLRPARTVGSADA